ncbi:MAG: Gfo/Idh/MocA family oxidoreductase [Treponema sp.]|nr:Gfo/Idh/MocA family oxidoreductase [Treponema sp.]
MTKVKLGIIGLGAMGSVHSKIIMDGLTPDITLAAAADTSPDRQTWAKNHLAPDIAIFNNDEELIKNADIDAVLIAVPHYQHPEITIKAFNRGLHVLCEKPAGVYTKQILQMNEIAAKSGKVFAIMYNQRTNSLYKKAHELVKSGNYGSIMRTSWIITNWFRSDSYYASGGWRGSWDGEGGGVLINQCPHQLDLFQWICGMPKSVRAFCHFGKWHNIEVEDDVTAYLEYPNGATGTFITTTGESPGTNRLEISMEKGKLIIDNDELTVFNLETNIREFCKTTKEFMVAPKFTIEKPSVGNENPQHAGVLRSFAAKILRNEPLIAEGSEGINAVILSNAMHLSTWLDKTIDIPFDDDLYLAELNKRRKQK